MHEMLANQYFISRNYPAASREIEKVLKKSYESKSFRKKLIICYTQTDKISEAIAIFSGLIEEDIMTILNTDIQKDYCPCHGLIYEYENDIIKCEAKQKILILGMLWLYCDIHESTKYFEEYNNKYPSDIIIRYILTKLYQTLHGDVKWTKKKLQEENF